MKEIEFFQIRAPKEKIEFILWGYSIVVKHWWFTDDGYSLILEGEGGELSEFAQELDDMSLLIHDVEEIETC